MARTKEFDPDAALQAALELFWRRGYEATSMSDLVEHLGIGRASLYATFGSKHELYLKALDRYAELSDPKLLDELSQPGPVLPAVRALVRRFATEAASEQRAMRLFRHQHGGRTGRPRPGRGPPGRGQLGPSGDPAALGAGPGGGPGELPPGREPRALARMLVVLLQGIRVVGKAASDPLRVHDAAEQALTLLD